MNNFGQHQAGKPTISPNTFRILIDEENYPAINDIISDFSSRHNSSSNKKRMDKELLNKLKNEFSQLSTSIEQSKTQFNMLYQELETRLKHFQGVKSINQTQQMFKPNSFLPPTPSTPPHSQTKQNSYLHSPPQKTGIRRQNRKSTSKNTNDRGNRAAEKYVPTVSSNPLNVWNHITPFFKAPPTEMEIEKLFAEREPAVFQTLPEDQLWAARFERVIRKTNGKALMPMAPNANDDTVSEQFLRSPPNFPVEEIQTKKLGPMHYLLSALVSAEPQADFDPYTDDDSDDPKDEFIQIHGLLPQIEFDSYLCYSFETRLFMEFESAGLNMDHEIEDKPNPFTNEMRDIKNEIQEYRPVLEKIKEKILEDLPEYHKDFEERVQQYEIYKIKYQDVVAPPRRKK